MKCIKKQNFKSHLKTCFHQDSKNLTQIAFSLFNVVTAEQETSRKHVIDFLHFIFRGLHKLYKVHSAAYCNGAHNIFLSLVIFLFHSNYLKVISTCPPAGYEVHNTRKQIVFVIDHITDFH